MNTNNKDLEQAKMLNQQARQSAHSNSSFTSEVGS